jgi:hypothetical protein
MAEQQLYCLYKVPLHNFPTNKMGHQPFAAKSLEAVKVAHLANMWNKAREI